MADRTFDITISIGTIENGFIMVVNSVEESDSGVLKISERKATYFKEFHHAQGAAEVELAVKCGIYADLLKKDLTEGESDG